VITRRDAFRNVATAAAGIVLFPRLVSAWSSSDSAAQWAGAA